MQLDELALADVIGAAVDAALAPVLKRLADVEARALVMGPAGRDGADGANGKDGAPGLNGQDGLDGFNGKDGAAGLNGKDGADGLHGKDGTPGLNGKDGAAGLNGKDGANGLNGKDAVLPDLDVLAQKAAALVPAPKDGRDGLPGQPGLTGEKGADGRDGKDGAAGLNGKDGSDGLHGKDGPDGIGFEDLDLVFDETTGYVLRGSNGTRTKDWPVPIPFDADVWQAGRLYQKGAGVTVKGAWWICRHPTRTRPGDGTPESSRDWRLAVKAGREGKPGKDGRDKE